MANDTVLFHLDDEALVARLAPAPDSPYPTFPTFDLAFQHGAIDLVRARTSVPVPEVVHLETSEEWLGVPFMVVREVAGDVPCDNPPYLIDPGGWFLRGTPDDWTAPRDLDDRRVRRAPRNRRRGRGHPRSFASTRPATPRSLACSRRTGTTTTGRATGTRSRSSSGPSTALHHHAGERSQRRALGRRPPGQHHLPRLRARRGARLGDGGRGPARGRPRVDNVLPAVLRAHGRAVGPPTGADDVRPPGHRGHLRATRRPPTRRPRVVRGARGTAGSGSSSPG